MSSINDVKQLVAKSRLFVDTEKSANTKGPQRSKRRRTREAIKIGQGGTLDPLADGVLGEYNQSTTALVTHINIITPFINFSCGCWKGDKKTE